MAPRPRNRSTRGLPVNLYVQRGDYFVWRDPRTGKVYPLGRDRIYAITQAIEANHHIAEAAGASLVDKLTGNDSRTVDAWCVEWLKSHPSARVQQLRRDLGDRVLSRIKPVDIGEWLCQWDDKATMRRAMLSTAKAIMSGAIGAGWLETNPAADLKTAMPIVKRSRLTIETFLAIREKAHPILARAMTLALVSGQRPGDVLKMQFSDVRDGYLHIEQNKGAHRGEGRAVRLRLPVGLHLAALNLTLGSAIAACRDQIVSKYMLHHIVHCGRAKPGHTIHHEKIIDWFGQARIAAGIVGPNPPTFYECRSLANRLYRQQGVDVKTLLGHKSQQMSDMYGDSRGAEWLTLTL